MLGEWLARLRFFFAGKSRAEVDDEIQFHFERQVAGQPRRGHVARRSAPPGGHPLRRPRAHARAVPPAAPFMVPRGLSARPSLWRARPPAQSRLHRRRRAHAGARHRRQFHHLQHAQPGPAARSSRAGSRPARSARALPAMPRATTTPKAETPPATSTNSLIPCTATCATATRF